ncbi:MAG: hypothetical protein WCF57_20935, partial [Pyrinomonadaceae bacterium]
MMLRRKRARRMISYALFTFKVVQHSTPVDARRAYGLLRPLLVAVFPGALAGGLTAGAAPSRSAVRPERVRA